MKVRSHLFHCIFVLSSSQAVTVVFCKILSMLSTDIYIMYEIGIESECK
jgi:5-bromo-4-chloroindolyl phosphate hydrolysis protein